MLLLALLLATPAFGQPADCPALPVGPPVATGAYLVPSGRPGVIAGAVLPPAPMYGTRCVTPRALPDDVLHGLPAPNGLLQGNGPRDVLHNGFTPEVVVGASPSDGEPTPP